MVIKADNTPTNSSSRPPVITVFQADPLALSGDGRDGTLQRLNIEEERRELKRRLSPATDEQNGAGVVAHLDFQIATVENIRQFLRHEENELLHISCHGDSGVLFIENHYGGADLLRVDENFEQMIRNRSKNLKCVFIAACCSYEAGQAFLAAEAEYVVCGANNESQLSNALATIFAGYFYQNLFAKNKRGCTVPQAFEDAKNDLRLSSHFKTSGLDPEKELEKITLLERDSTQRTSLHYTSHESSVSLSTRAPDTRLQKLPRPPDNFVGRALVMYEVIKDMIVHDVRLVSIAGPRGIGKSSCAKALACYLQERKMWGNVYLAQWTSTPIGDIDLLLHKIMALVAVFQDFSPTLELICDRLQEKEAVIIFDTSKFRETIINGPFSKFLHALYNDHRTKEVKVIVLLQEKMKLGHVASQGVSFRAFTLNPLDFNSAMYLYTRECQVIDKNFEKEVSSMCQSELASFAKVRMGNYLPANIVENARALLNKSDIDRTAFTKEAAYMYLLHNPDRIRSLFGTQVPTGLSSAVLPVRTQAAVLGRCLASKKEQGETTYRKIVPGYIRRAKRGDIVTTTIDGVKESHHIVKDNTSRVVCGKLNKECYVQTDAQFRKNYDPNSKRLIQAPEHQNLREKGYYEYAPIGQVRAHVVDQYDMDWFLHGATNTENAYFEAPWGVNTIVREGDYLVYKCNKEIYRVDRETFEQTYSASVRSQDMVQEEFLDRVRSTSKLFRNIVPRYIKRVWKNDTFETIKGDPESRDAAKENGWLVCRQSTAGEFYFMTSKQFERDYDPKSGKPIERTSEEKRHLADRDFSEYQPIYKVWAHPVDEVDMQYFRCGAKNTENAYLVEPSGRPKQVKQGDYLVTKYARKLEDCNGEIYLVSREDFDKYYSMNPPGTVTTRPLKRKIRAMMGL